MKSYPTFEEVLADIGDTVTAGLGKAAALALLDLREYRELRPDWVAQASQRGLANWIHDRLWVHLVTCIGSLREVQIVDREPLREIYIGVRYRLRVKRHQDDGAVRTYPTQTALEFYIQPQRALEGLEEIRLATGYDWDREVRQIGPAVLSLRDGRDKVVWYHEIPTPPAEQIAVLQPVAAGPVPPAIDLDGEQANPDREVDTG